jgi:hypothetical protein
MKRMILKSRNVAIARALPGSLREYDAAACRRTFVQNDLVPEQDRFKLAGADETLKYVAHWLAATLGLHGAHADNVRRHYYDNGPHSKLRTKMWRSVPLKFLFFAVSVPIIKLHSLRHVRGNHRPRCGKGGS